MADDGRAAIESAAHVVSQSFVQHRYSMIPMECRGIVAQWEPFDQRLDVWMSSQNPHEARLVFSRATGVPENQIRVQIGDVGGGFGLKSFVGREEIVIAIAAHELGAAIKWSEDRRENLIASAHARQEKCDATLAVDDDGVIVASERQALRRRRRVPDARWLGRPARRHAVHRSLPGAAPRLGRAPRSTPTPAAPRRTAVRG